jgi:hypothetical protein
VPRHDALTQFYDCGLGVDAETTLDSKLRVLKQQDCLAYMDEAAQLRLKIARVSASCILTFLL